MPRWSLLWISGRVVQSANPSSPGSGIDEPLDGGTLDLGAEVIEHPQEDLAYLSGADPGLSKEHLPERKAPEWLAIWGRCLMEHIPHRYFTLCNS